MVGVSAVVVVDILCKDEVQVTLTENNEPVKTFLADRMDPALGKRIGFRRERVF